MNGKQATSYFHGKEGYNCAQAILKAFQDRYNVSNEMIEQYKQYGGGRAEGGTCGALYAALALASDDQKQMIKTIFEQAANNTLCEEIKDKTLSCQDCVAVAAEALCHS